MRSGLSCTSRNARTRGVKRRHSLGLGLGVLHGLSVFLRLRVFLRFGVSHPWAWRHPWAWGLPRVWYLRVFLGLDLLGLGDVRHGDLMSSLGLGFVFLDPCFTPVPKRNRKSAIERLLTRKCDACPGGEILEMYFYVSSKSICRAILETGY